ncbi:multidrug efflux SMR transporter [Verrucomicrobiaceae bacterium R5-34]|uniref:Guanidinium exporter n=1 Tax=Oceaniferula flava TaxID=2800421 RepID=A0AAE2SFU5_9BACT|nr:multidrug efflux SMR transporter [Oceaniferula flavus]MBK1830959.1 multidrug efflux SMR transporter [Verrucomicrobiaceae bacterium R5-34]MBK1855805.1 multidrug efflux SMR transporter [Oceaniferula flavus]MBM1137112.1 multidrug efflux SMR transporter [Oceaniferula flavus]
MNWIILILAGMLEIGWAVGLKYTEGFTRPWITALTLTIMFGSVGLLSVAMKSIPIGTAYAVWVGIGIIGTVIWGVCFFEESLNAGRMICLAMVLAGVIGLKITA